MQRSELEHLIRASGEIAGDNEIIVIGSQSILGQFPKAPVRLLISMEADIYPKNKPERADMVDGAIGEGSSFHELHGYYAQGVGEKTAVLPNGWRSRLVVVNNENTNGVTGLCLEVHDLAISKLIAQRLKDIEFVQGLVLYNMIQKETMLSRLEETDLQASFRSRIQSRIDSLFTVRKQR
ncbi:MAG: hypothetical protein OEW73_15240 [Gammaproteobacteria bacterium]|jgi:hypothetical protein|nr:hypothetical protein [Gammaproteobacteria bacterium]MDH5242128.1 hypothetical protein [Gammaproteobacteria bacterium]MDH5262775.1 hypothetical protein [Gammaproteobacteria bacterium]MDH5584262.1 hypothetical protein [Gammaproteobacteria bacterium]